MLDLLDRKDVSVTGAESRARVFGGAETSSGRDYPSATQGGRTFSRFVATFGGQYALNVQSDLWTGPTNLDWAFLPGSEDQTDIVVYSQPYLTIQARDESRGQNYLRLSAAQDRSRFLLTKAPTDWIAVVAMPVTAAIGVEVGLPPLAATVADLRRKIDLPVHDIAKMCGVGRRQFYNLMQGSSKTAVDEARIRRVHTYVNRLYSRSGGHSDLVRRAALLPIAELDFKSFYDLAADGAREPLDRAFAFLLPTLDRVPQDEILPMSLRASAEQAKRAQAALAELRRLTDDDVE